VFIYDKSELLYIFSAISKSIAAEFLRKKRPYVFDFVGCFESKMNVVSNGDASG